MKKGVVPCPGIDTDARWGYSHTKGWIFGYKLHLTCTTGELVVPLTVDVTTANVQDTDVCSFNFFFFFCILFTICIVMIVIQAMTIRTSTKSSKKILGIDLVCPVERYESTSKKRLELVCFYQSALGQSIYNLRGISV